MTSLHYARKYFRGNYRFAKRAMKVAHGKFTPAKPFLMVGNMILQQQKVSNRDKIWPFMIFIIQNKSQLNYEGNCLYAANTRETPHPSLTGNSDSFPRQLFILYMKLLILALMSFCTV